jgi:ketosteroid isomerase-like protein
MVDDRNLELVRSIYSAWERGDYRSDEWADPEIEFVMADGPDRGSWTGLSEMARAARAALRAWEEHRLVADGLHPLDDERILVLSHRTARGKTSGLTVQADGAELFHIRNGKVTKLVRYLDREGAFAALGWSSAAG